MKLLVKAMAGVVLVVVIVLILIVTCPDEDSFKSWAKENIASGSGSLVEKARDAALTVQAKWTADYDSHVLWATVDVYQGGTEQRFVGILGTWFRLGGE